MNLYRETESYVSHQQTKQASMHALRSGTQSKRQASSSFIKGFILFWNLYLLWWIYFIL